MMLELAEPWPVHTPKGTALAKVIIDYGLEHDLMYVCIIDETGEFWTFRNSQIRAQENLTYGREYLKERGALKPLSTY